MILIKANANSEAGVMPSERLMTEMGQFNEELVNAGIMKAMDGLHPSTKAKRVRFAGGKTTVIDGPFAETKELLAGFWIWDCASMDEALSWVKRIPSPDDTTGDGIVEIRQIFEMDDFGEEFTPELRVQEDRLRAQLEGNA